MCTYNSEAHIREQLDSIIYQSYPVYELIVQDDHSTDRTVEIIQEYAFQYSFIKLFVNEETLGYNQNYLSALLRAKGDVIALADQDDIWHKEKLMKQINKLNEGFYLVFHNSCLFKDVPTHLLGRRYSENPIFTELRLILKPFIPGHECLFSKEILPVIKEMYEQVNNISYDSVIALTCLTLGKIAYLDEDLVYWRRHIQATTYQENQKKNGSIAGALKSLSSLIRSKNKKIIIQYCKVISILPFKTAVAQKMVYLLQQNTLQLIKACLLCGQHTSALFCKTSLRNKVKATFAPLHLFRDGDFLIK